MGFLDYVNIKQGSDSRFDFSNGNTLPLTQMPFGMGGFAIETRGSGIWFFHPDDRTLDGIRYTHQPSPWIGDFGCITFMPQAGEALSECEERRSEYDPENTVIRPDYLRLAFLRYDAEMHLAPTERGGIMKLLYRGDKLPRFAVMPAVGCCAFRVFDDNTVVGYSTQQGPWGAVDFKMHFVFKFDCRILKDETYITKTNGEKALSADGRDGFDGINIALENREVTVRFASSYISEEQAFLNLSKETESLSFEECRERAEKRWEDLLSRVEVETYSEEQKKTFYSCLARTFLYPNLSYETDKDGEEIHYCPHDGSVAKGKSFTNNGFWDTFRTVYPLYSLVCPEIYKDILEGFINIYKDSGWLPRWPSCGETGVMPATFIDAVIADAAVKGIIDGELLSLAFEGMQKHAKTPPSGKSGRNGLSEMLRYGFVPNHIKESVNESLDGYYCDYCISEAARILGREEERKEFFERSRGYYRLFDRESGFMRGRDTEGRFREPFIPHAWGGDYTEGSAYQSSFAVQHDIEGLALLHGSNDKLIEKLDEVFSTPPIYDVGAYGMVIHEMAEMAAADFGQCAISNQPSFHLPYMFSYLGDREKTEYWVRRIVTEAFSSANDGFPGDEDNGTMSGWYVFSAMGLYPICPGKPFYVKGVKLLKSVYINGKELDIDRFEGNLIAHSDIIG